MGNSAGLESGLYVVATPIGNLGDMVPRAVETLQQADLIAAEDTRHSAPLLKHFSIETPMIAYHDHSNEAAVSRIQRCIEAGGAVALISDAGTPLISDPGYRLLKYAHEQGWRVVPIPGASALTAALSVAGLATDRFRFEGFLPAKAAARQSRLEALAAESATLVFYEAPHRLLTTLKDLQGPFEETRRLAVTRELTKQFEEVWRGTLAEAIAHFTTTPPKGEFTLVIAGKPPSETPPLTVEELTAQLTNLLAQGLSRSQASRQLAQTTSYSKREIYQLAIELPDPTIAEGDESP